MVISRKGDLGQVGRKDELKTKCSPSFVLPLVREGRNISADQSLGQSSCG